MRPSLLNPEQAAKVLQMDSRTLIYWARRRDVPAHPMGEGKRKMWRFVESELVEWVKGQGNGSPSRPLEATMETAIGAHVRRNRMSRFQQGSLLKLKRKNSPDVWVFRWYDETDDKRTYKKRTLGTVIDLPQRWMQKKPWPNFAPTLTSRSGCR